MNYENVFHNISHLGFIEDIINGMYDWVRVIDTNDNLIFVNDSMAKNMGESFIGNKCYRMLGRNSPCENCTSRKAVFKGIPQLKEEIVQDRIFSVMSSPIKNSSGKIVAVVEVLRDITDIKNMQKKIIAQNTKLKNELAMAQKLQLNLLPKDISKNKIHYSYFYKPCEALSGDFLDIFQIDDENIGIYVADVSGHGLVASMLTIFLRSSLNKYCLSPASALSQLYKEFNNTYTNQDLYITIFYAIINTKKHNIVYSNAGLNVSPILFNNSNDKFSLLRVSGIPISDWVESPEYKDVNISFEKGDRLFLYSDGVMEFKNKNGKQYGEVRLLDILLKDTDIPKCTLDKIISDACLFSSLDNLDNLIDDITMLLVEFTE